MNTSNLYLFMAGDNNLDVAARKDIAEDLMGNQLSERTTVYVQFDRRSPLPWEMDLNEFTTKRFRILNGEKQLQKQLGETNTGNREVLTSFFNESIQDREARHHVAIIWGHGGGIKANKDFKDEGYKWVGIDDSSMDTLSINELATSFENTSVNFTIIGFDACLMAVLEVAYALRKQGKFMLASQALEPTNGWCYKSFLSLIDTASDLNSKTLIKSLTHSYLNSYLNTSKSVTLSAINLANVEEVAQKRDRFAEQLIHELKLNKEHFISAYFQAQRFKDRHYADLVHFVQLCKATTNSVELKRLADELLIAINQMMVANVKKGEQYRNANGISALLPLSLDHPLPYELEIHKNYPYWLALIQTVLTT